MAAGCGQTPAAQTPYLFGCILPPLASATEGRIRRRRFITAFSAFALAGVPRRAGGAAATGGSAKRGRQALLSYGCTACHRISGISEARGLVGPPLERFQQKLYIAGSLPNTPDMLVEWIQHPRQLRPGTAMPETGVGEAEARDITAYLYAQQ
jgi:cytochrome c1